MNKKTFVRIFSLILAAVLVLGIVSMGVVALAATPDTLYFKPSTNWKEANARFAAYFFGNGNTWVDMTDSDGDGIYECAAPAGFPSVIFVRMNPDTTENNWNDGVKWNQTADLTIPTDGKNCFAVNEGEWNGAQGTWSTVENDNTCAHEWGAGSVTTEVTCEKNGVKTYTCSLCGNTKTEAIIALGHNYVDGTCDRCGNVQAATRVIYFVNTDGWTTVNAYAWNSTSNEKFLGEWPGTAMNKVEGNLYSITVSGEATHIIFNNGGDQTPDLELSTEYNRYTWNGNWDYYSTCEHTYDNGTVTTAPTCTEEGEKTLTCTACGHTKTEVVAALGHIYVNGTCGLCGEAEPCDHLWDNGSTTTAATCTTDGVKTYTCRTCGETKTETIKAAGHKYLDGVCYNCGEKEPVVEYFEIYTAADLATFASKVNAGDNKLNGKLMANIDLKGASWTPIGIYCPGGDPTKSVYFGGIFNGNGYTVSNFTVSGTDCVGLFGYADNRATIMNLGVINATMTGWNAGAICGFAPTATIMNCYAIGCTITGNTTNPVAVKSEAVHVGAITGSNAGTVKNCYAMNCTLTTTFVGQFNSMSPLGGTIPSNNYYCNVTGTFTNTTGATSVTAAQIASGEVAYKLADAAWGQEIGKDAYPVIFGKTVFFENGTYTNEGTVECAHEWKAATCTAPKTCTKCGATEGEALGHASVTYSYVNNVHTFTCDVCGEVAFTKTEGKKFNFSSVAPALSDDIVMTYTVRLPAGFELSYVTFELNGETTYAYEWESYVSGGVNYANVKFPGLNPQKMGDVINATAYAIVDGYTVSVSKENFGFVDYCNLIMDKAPSESLRVILSNVLVYGAKTQAYQGYKLEEPILDKVTFELNATPLNNVPTDLNVMKMVGTTNQAVKFSSVGLVLSGKMTMRYTIKTTTPENYTYRITINGVNYDYTAEDLVADENTAGVYYLNFDQIKATQFGLTITACFLENGVQTSKALEYSVYSYVAMNQGTGDAALADLLKAIYNYGESAKNV